MRRAAQREEIAEARAGARERTSAATVWVSGETLVMMTGSYRERAWRPGAAGTGAEDGGGAVEGCPVTDSSLMLDDP